MYNLAYEPFLVYCLQIKEKEVLENVTDYKILDLILFIDISVAQYYTTIIRMQRDN